MSCRICGSTSKQQCSGCLRATYCSTNCQQKDWVDQHQFECIGAALPQTYIDITKRQAYYEDLLANDKYANPVGVTDKLHAAYYKHMMNQMLRSRLKQAASGNIDPQEGMTARQILYSMGVTQTLPPSDGYDPQTHQLRQKPGRQPYYRKESITNSDGSRIVRYRHADGTTTDVTKPAKKSSRSGPYETKDYRTGKPRKRVFQSNWKETKESRHQDNPSKLAILRERDPAKRAQLKKEHSERQLARGKNPAKHKAKIEAQKHKMELHSGKHDKATRHAMKEEHHKKRLAHYTSMGNAKKMEKHKGKIASNQRKLVIKKTKDKTTRRALKKDHSKKRHAEHTRLLKHHKKGSTNHVKLSKKLGKHKKRQNK